MKIGFCAKLDMISEVAAAGFDYIEPSVTSVQHLTDEEIGAYCQKMEEAHISAPSFNVLFPKDMELLQADPQEIYSYLDGALARVRKLGGRVVVFGSGKSRMRPESMHYDDAFRRLAGVTRMIGDIAGKYGITIVIEPLNRGETNMINSVAEGACLRAAVNHPSVQLLADYYHIAVEHQPPEDLARLQGIWHAHIATEIGRKVPVERDEGYVSMLRAMKATGYQGLLSVEGKSDDLSQDGPRSVALLRQLWEEA